jgi:ribonuclease HI
MKVKVYVGSACVPKIELGAYSYSLFTEDKFIYSAKESVITKSNHRMKCKAMIKAIRWAKNNVTGMSEITIYSNYKELSLAYSKAIRAKRVTSDVTEAFQKMKRYLDRNKITLTFSLTTDSKEATAQLVKSRNIIRKKAKGLDFDGKPVQRVTGKFGVKIRQVDGWVRSMIKNQKVSDVERTKIRMLDLEFRKALAAKTSDDVIMAHYNTLKKISDIISNRRF